MANPRPPLDETTLRETKDDLMRAVQDQRRDLGVPVPDQKTAEEFVDPILRRVEVERHDEINKDHWRPEKHPEPEQTFDGEWFGEAEHSPSLRGWTATSREIGTVKINPGTGQASYSGVLNQPPPRRPMPPAIAAAHKRFAELKALPEWRARIQRVMFSNHTPEEKEKAYMEILADSVRLFGDPRGVKAGKLHV